jgi:hypothetical protein
VFVVTAELAAKMCAIDAEKKKLESIVEKYKDQKANQDYVSVDILSPLIKAGECV